MKTYSLWLAAIAALSSNGVDCRNVIEMQPKATASVVLPDDGISPRPTPPPGWDSFHDLMRRATSSQTPLTMMIAPDNTCGWVSGRINIPFSCPITATCGLVLAQKTFSGAVMCFNNAGYNYRFACVDYDDYFTSSRCDHLCAEDFVTLKWYVLYKLMTVYFSCSSCCSEWHGMASCRI